MIDWVKQAYNDLIEWFKAILQAVFDFFTDLFVKILDGFLDAVASIFESIEVPDFIGQGLGYFFSFLDPSILYFLDRSGMPEALALIGAGYTFRMLRKIFTLFQW